MLPCHNIHREEKGVKRLTSAYKDLPNIQAILNALLAQTQELETATYAAIYAGRIGVSRVPVPVQDKGCCDGPPPDLTDATRVAVVLDAEGVYLNPVGELVGEARNGRTDAEYLVAIKAKIRVNQSNGLAEDIIQIARLATPYGTPITYSEPQEATFLLEAYGFEGAKELALLLNKARMGGVRGILQFSEEPLEDLFIFGSVSAPTLGNGPESVSGGTPAAHYAAVTDF